MGGLKFIAKKEDPLTGKEKRVETVVNRSNCMEFYGNFEFSKKKWSRINGLKRKQTKLFKIRELKLKEGGQAVKKMEFCNEVEPASKDYNSKARLMSRASELHENQTVARLPIQLQPSSGLKVQSQRMLQYREFNNNKGLRKAFTTFQNRLKERLWEKENDLF